MNEKDVKSFSEIQKDQLMRFYSCLPGNIRADISETFDNYLNAFLGLKEGEYAKFTLDPHQFYIADAILTAFETRQNILGRNKEDITYLRGDFDKQLERKAEKLKGNEEKGGKKLKVKVYMGGTVVFPEDE